MTPRRLYFPFKLQWEDNENIMSQTFVVDKISKKNAEFKQKWIAKKFNENIENLKPYNYIGFIKGNYNKETMTIMTKKYKFLVALGKFLSTKQRTGEDIKNFIRKKDFVVVYEEEEETVLYTLGKDIKNLNLIDWLEAHTSLWSPFVKWPFEGPYGDFVWKGEYSYQYPKISKRSLYKLQRSYEHVMMFQFIYYELTIAHEDYKYLIETVELVLLWATENLEEEHAKKEEIIIKRLGEEGLVVYKKMSTDFIR